LHPAQCQNQSNMKQIPNLFTLLNLAFGFFAIIFILQTGELIVVMDTGGSSVVNFPEKITWGAIFIFAAALVDFLDGFLARLLKAPSAMGLQLDSLADLVSFGVAPGLIIYQLLRMGYAALPMALEIPMLYLVPAVLLPCAGAWRLARFNIDTEQSTVFRGLPIPAAGITVAALPMIIWFQNFNLQRVIIQPWLLYIVIAGLSLLMISRIKMLSMKFKSFGFAENMPRYLLLILGILCAVFLKWVAIPAMLLIYVALSLAFKKQNT